LIPPADVTSPATDRLPRAFHHLPAAAETYVELTIGAPATAVAEAARACVATGAAMDPAEQEAKWACSRGMGWALLAESDAFWDEALRRTRPEEEAEEEAAEEGAASGDDGGAPREDVGEEEARFAVGEDEEDEEAGAPAEAAAAVAGTAEAPDAAGSAPAAVPGAAVPSADEAEAASAHEGQGRRGAGGVVAAAAGAAAAATTDAAAKADEAADDVAAMDDEFADIEALEASLAAGGGGPTGASGLHASAVSDADTDLSDFESFLDEV